MRRLAALSRGLAVGVGLLAPGCGGGGAGTPTAPSGPAVVDAGIPAGTRLSVVSGETLAPVAGAQVVIGGRTVVSDASGQVALPERAAAQSALDIVAPGFLDRITLLRSQSETRFTLWPKTSSTGLDEHFTATLVYTRGEEGDALAEEPLRRLGDGTRRVGVVLAESLAGDEARFSRHAEAVEQLTAATGGQVVYALASQAEPGVLAVNATFDPEDENCAERVRAVTLTQLRGGTIVSARIVYCVDDAPRSSTVTHELGHTFGLSHSPNEREVMAPNFSRSRANDFSARESLAMQLMLQRRPGNRHPDNDRDMGSTQSAGFSGTVVTICR